MHGPETSEAAVERHKTGAEFEGVGSGCGGERGREGPPAALDDDEDEDDEFDPVALAQSLITEQVAAVEDIIASDAAAKLELDPKDETDDALLSLLISLGMSGDHDITDGARSGSRMPWPAMYLQT